MKANVYNPSLDLFVGAGHKDWIISHLSPLTTQYLSISGRKTKQAIHASFTNMEYLLSSSCLATADTRRNGTLCENQELGMPVRTKKTSQAIATTWYATTSTAFGTVQYTFERADAIGN